MRNEPAAQNSQSRRPVGWVKTQLSQTAVRAKTRRSIAEEIDPRIFVRPAGVSPLGLDPAYGTIEADLMRHSIKRAFHVSQRILTRTIASHSDTLGT